MAGYALRYLGPRSDASLGYFTGASVRLEAGQCCVITEGGTLVGRRSSADLRIAGSAVSPHHARLSVHGGALRVVDADSTNGTTVNGARVRDVLLQLGDRVTFADAFDFEVIEAPPTDSLG